MIIFRILRRKSNDPLIEEFLSQVLTPATAPITHGREVKSYPDCCYWNYKCHGLSLLFRYKASGDRGNSAENMTLDSVILFNKGAYGYQRYRGPMPFPGMQFESMSNRDIVQRFGEPQKKGGGGLAPIWFTYSTRQATFVKRVREELKDSAGHGGAIPSSFSMQVELVDKDWNNRCNAVASITIFPEE